MERLPDLTPLFWLAGFGLLVGVVGGFSLVGWLGYHLYRALALYLGVTA